LPLGFVGEHGTAHTHTTHHNRTPHTQDEFMELFAIGQGLPGPTSTQLVVSTATSRAGMLGGVLALLMWNMPGLIVCTVCSVLAKGAEAKSEAASEAASEAVSEAASIYMARV
jgi:chromate transporter